MAGDEDGEPLFFGQLADKLAQLANPRRIQAVGRLVEDQQLGPVQQRLRDPQPLPHAERVRFHLVVNRALKIDKPHNLLDALRTDAAAHPREMLQIFPSRHKLVHLRILHDAAHLGDCFRKLIAQRYAADPNISGIRGSQPHQHADGGCLSGTIGPEKTEYLTGEYVEGDITDNRLAAYLFLQSFYRQDRLRHQTVLLASLTAPIWAQEVILCYTNPICTMLIIP